MPTELQDVTPSAVQAGDTAIAGRATDIVRVTLGTAAGSAATAFATSAQGAAADTAVQPARAVAAGTGLAGGGDLSVNRTLSLSAGSIASLSLADSAVQPARAIAAGTGLAGGGSLAADRTVSLSAGSIASLLLADSATQPGDLATVATSGAYADLSGRPTLGTAAAAATGDFATAAQGTLAGTAVQPARTITAGTGLTGGGDLSANRTVALSSGSIASLGLADSATQPGDLGDVAAMNEADNAAARAGTANRPIAADVAYSAMGPVTLSDGATITPNLNAGRVLTVTLAGNRTLANPTTLTVGQSGLIIVTQDATGTRTLAYGSAWKFPGGAPTLSTGANDVDVISYYVQVADPAAILCTLAKDFS